jgi:hypothetical protein
MTNQVIPAEAVEAAAKAHQGKPVGRMSWDELAPMVRKIRLKKMRAALEAAAPHMTICTHDDTQGEIR